MCRAFSQRYFIFDERKQCFTFVLGIKGSVLVSLYYDDPRGRTPSSGSQEGSGQRDGVRPHLPGFDQHGVIGRVGLALRCCCDECGEGAHSLLWLLDRKLLRDVGS